MRVRKGLVLVPPKGHNRTENVDGAIAEKYEDLCTRENKTLISLIFFQQLYYKRH